MRCSLVLNAIRDGCAPSHEFPLSFKFARTGVPKLSDSVKKGLKKQTAKSKTLKQSIQETNNDDRKQFQSGNLSATQTNVENQARTVENASKPPSREVTVSSAGSNVQVQAAHKYTEKALAEQNNSYLDPLGSGGAGFGAGAAEGTFEGMKIASLEYGPAALFTEVSYALYAARAGDVVEIGASAGSTASKVSALVPTKGRFGNLATRKQISDIAIELENRGYTITGGGGMRAEEYLRAPLKTKML